MKTVFQKDSIRVEKHFISQDRNSGKEELFVTWNGYDFGVFQMHELTRAIDTAVNLSNVPAGERYYHQR